MVETNVATVATVETLAVKALTRHKAGETTLDYAPLGLRNQMANVAALMARIANGATAQGNGSLRPSARKGASSGKLEAVLYIWVKTANGGSEFRPMAEFTQIPINPAYFLRRPTTKKPVYDSVNPDGAQTAVAPTTAAPALIPSATAAPTTAVTTVPTTVPTAAPTSPVEPETSTPETDSAAAAETETAAPAPAKPKRQRKAPAAKAPKKAKGK